MKKLIALICMAALLSGCHANYGNPYRVDTVVRIPVNPAEEASGPAPAETEPAPTDAPKKSTSSGKTSGSSGGKGSSAEKSTEPPATAAPTEAPFVPSEYTPGALEYAILEQVNAYRRDAALPELSMDEDLCEMAAVRSSETARVWSHTRPGGRGFETVLEDYDFSYTQAAENLINGVGTLDASKIVAKWMESESHRANILSEAFTSAGVGLYETGGVSYITVLFVG